MPADDVEPIIELEVVTDTNCGAIATSTAPAGAGLSPKTTAICSSGSVTKVVFPNDNVVPWKLHIYSSG